MVFDKRKFHMRTLYSDSMRRIEAYLIGPMPPPFSGQSITFAMLCDRFRDLDVSYKVINFSEGRTRADGRISWHRLLSLAGPSLAAIMLIFRPRAKVYLTNAQSWTGFLKDMVFIACARLGRHQLILHAQGGNYHDFYHSKSSLGRLVIRRTLALADRLIVLGDSLTEMYSFIPDYRSKVVVVPNGLPDKMPEWQVTLAVKNTNNTIRILYLSNLIESKGYLDVLEAARVLVQDHRLEIQADFCGEFWLISDSKLYRSTQEAQADFRRRIEAYGLRERVFWHGSVAGEQKRELLARAHFFVLPTNYKYEGQPVSIIEAMAYGALVISTRYRTIPEMLDEGKAGIFVRPGHPDDIVEAILLHPVGSPTYRRLVKAARQRCAEMFSRERHLERLIAVITDSPAGGNRD